jgi:hypothetical protein
MLKSENEVKNYSRFLVPIKDLGRDLLGKVTVRYSYLHTEGKDAPSEVIASESA